MATSTRENLISVGIEFFHQYGFHAVGLDQVLQQVGVTKTTFYNHFESKEDLIRSAINEQGIQLRAWMQSGVERIGGDDPRQQLLAIFDVLDEMFRDDEYRGCLVINALVEFPGPHDIVHSAAAENQDTMCRIFLKLAESAGVPDPQSFTGDLCILVEGAVMGRKVHRDPHAAMRAKRLAEMLLDDVS